MDKENKSIVVYYSAQNHTRNVATKIADDINADIFEIEPVQAYTEDDLNNVLGIKKEEPKIEESAVSKQE